MEKIVEVKNLSKRYGSKKALDDVSLEISSNEIVGLIGPNGAGKSTLMKCLCNLIFPDSGEIFINGFDLFEDTEKALSTQAAMIEQPGLYPDMSGIENIRLIAKLRKVSKQRIKEVCDFIGIGGYALGKKVSQYSLGMKQRLGLGIAIMTRPKFIILDEPTNGLDPTGIIEFRKTLQQLVQEDGIAILFSSHQLGEIEKLADRILCINSGRLIDTPEMLDRGVQYILQIRASNASELEKARDICGGEIHIAEEGLLRFQTKAAAEFSEILRALIAAKVVILDLYKEAIDVESVYKSVYINPHSVSH